VPEVPTLTSLFVILGILATTITTSLYANRRAKAADPDEDKVAVP
jgi:tellurite resistance protein TerC